MSADHDRAVLTPAFSAPADPQPTSQPTGAQLAVTFQPAPADPAVEPDSLDDEDTP